MEDIYPIAFIDNICPKCAKKNTLRFLDKYDNENKNLIYPQCKMKCLSCNTVYFLRWINDDKNRPPLPAWGIKVILEEEI